MQKVKNASETIQKGEMKTWTEEQQWKQKERLARYYYNWDRDNLYLSLCNQLY